MAHHRNSRAKHHAHFRLHTQPTSEPNTQSTPKSNIQQNQPPDWVSYLVIPLGLAAIHFCIVGGAYQDNKRLLNTGYAFTVATIITLSTAFIYYGCGCKPQEDQQSSTPSSRR